MNIYKLALVSVLSNTLCATGFSSNLDDLGVVRETQTSRHNFFMSSDAGNPRDRTSQVNADRKYPNMPHFAANEAINFPLIVRLPGAHFGGNLLSALREQLIQEGIMPNNFYVGVVAQNIPYSAQTRYSFVPHTYLYPNAPAQQAGYVQQMNIKTALFGINNNEIRFGGRSNVDQIALETIRLDQNGDRTNFVSDNLIIDGLNPQIPSCFFSYVSFNDNNVRSAIICLHLLLKDDQCQVLQASLMGKTLSDLGKRANLAELLRVTPRNNIFQGFNGLGKIVGLLREPRAFVPVQVVNETGRFNSSQPEQNPRAAAEPQQSSARTHPTRQETSRERREAPRRSEEPARAQASRGNPDFTDFFNNMSNFYDDDFVQSVRENLRRAQEARDRAARGQPHFARFFNSRPNFTDDDFIQSVRENLRRAQEARDRAAREQQEAAAREEARRRDETSRAEQERRNRQHRATAPTWNSGYPSANMFVGQPLAENEADIM